MKTLNKLYFRRPVAKNKFPQKVLFMKTTLGSKAHLHPASKDDNNIDLRSLISQALPSTQWGIHVENMFDK